MNPVPEILALIETLGWQAESAFISAPQVSPGWHKHPWPQTWSAVYSPSPHGVLSSDPGPAGQALCTAKPLLEWWPSSKATLTGQHFPVAHTPSMELSHLSLHQTPGSSHRLQGAVPRDQSPEQSHLLVGLEDSLCWESSETKTPYGPATARHLFTGKWKVCLSRYQALLQKGCTRALLSSGFWRKDSLGRLQPAWRRGGELLWEVMTVQPPGSPPTALALHSLGMIRVASTQPVHNWRLLLCRVCTYGQRTDPGPPNLPPQDDREWTQAGRRDPGQLSQPGWSRAAVNEPRLQGKDLPSTLCQCNVHTGNSPAQNRQDSGARETSLLHSLGPFERAPLEKVKSKKSPSSCAGPSGADVPGSQPSSSESRSSHERRLSSPCCKALGSPSPASTGEGEKSQDLFFCPFPLPGSAQCWGPKLGVFLLVTALQTSAPTGVTLQPVRKSRASPSPTVWTGEGPSRIPCATSAYERENGRIRAFTLLPVPVDASC